MAELAMGVLRSRSRWVALASLATLVVVGLALWPKAPGRPALALSFSDGEDRPVTLADFQGKVLLLNLWATWCAPCRHEMPALDRLQEKLGGRDFQVVALSVDRGGLAAVRRFYEQVGVRSLSVYVDAPGTALRQTGATGLPTTLLIDRNGREIRRFIGPAEWDGPAMVDLVQNAVVTEKRRAP